jgi:hypothetical protein
MPELSAEQITQYATQALPQQVGTGNIAIAVAIALAESGGDTQAHNANPLTGDDSYGVWQINMYRGLGPDRRRQYNLPNNEALYDPATNARVMAGISKGGTDWTPWSTFKRGEHLKYLFDLPGVEAKGPLGGALDPLADIGTYLQKAATWMADSNNWARVAEVVAGGLLIMVAANTIVRPILLDTVKKAKPI